MPGQTIGQSMPHGYAGSYARQPDMIIDSHPMDGTQNALFGTALVYKDGGVVPFGAGHTAADFVGVAAREVKSAFNYQYQNVGQYCPGEAVSVLKRGCVNVICNVGTPALGGKVFLRTAANEAIPTGAVGGFEAQADGGNCVELTTCQWRGGADADGVAELRILNLNRA